MNRILVSRGVLPWVLPYLYYHVNFCLNELHHLLIRYSDNIENRIIPSLITIALVLYESSVTFLFPFPFKSYSLECSCIQLAVLVCIVSYAPHVCYNCCSYELEPAFEEVEEEAMIDISPIDSKEFWLIQWPKDKVICGSFFFHPSDLLSICRFIEI
jgi:hypothetical protein